VDATSVANEARRARSRLRVTGADENRIQRSLHISRYKLNRISTFLLSEYTNVFIFLRLAESTNRPKRASRWSTLKAYRLDRVAQSPLPTCEELNLAVVWIVVAIIKRITYQVCTVTSPWSRAKVELGAQEFGTCVSNRAFHFFGDFTLRQQ
jgi:hypothetical protein